LGLEVNLRDAPAGVKWALFPWGKCRKTMGRCGKAMGKYRRITGKLWGYGKTMRTCEKI